MTRVLTEMPEEIELDPEHLKVVGWRLNWLRAAGYRLSNAERIAYDITIDYRFACDLRDKCKDERLCMQILFGKQ